MIQKQYGWFLKLILPKDVSAITLWPFGIYYKSNPSNNTFQHELVHWRQQKEMIGLFFYLWYGIEWLIKLIFYGKMAYYHISFEQEAYKWKEISGKHYGWFKYVLK